MAPRDTEPRPWTFRDRDGEERTYEQRELTIDGEIQLFSLIGRSLGKLREVGFPFQDLAKVLPDNTTSLENYDWNAAGELAALAAMAIPSLASEAMAIMFGQFPTDEHGRRNAAWTDEVAYLRRVIHVADVVEAADVFTRQNDMERLQAPFSAAIRSLIERGLTSPSPYRTAAETQQPSTSSSSADTAPPAPSAARSHGQTSPAPLTQ